MIDILSPILLFFGSIVILVACILFILMGGLLIREIIRDWNN